MKTLYTISQLAKCFNLSRSTLLYYDRKKIFQPSSRTDNRYRLYNENDYKVLQKICVLREVGIPLKDITRVIKSSESSFSGILNERLLNLNQEIHRLREHQRLIVSLLGNKKLLRLTRSMNKESWVNLLKLAGLDEKGMRKWHQEFEKNAPDAHQDFLESLGLSGSEIKKIRQQSSGRI